VVHILPALFGVAVPNGNVKGLLARGGFVVDVTWKDGDFAFATVTSKHGKRLALRVTSGGDITVNDQPYSGPFETTLGAVYNVAFA